MRADIRGMYRITKYGRRAPYYVADCLLNGCTWTIQNALRQPVIDTADLHARGHLKVSG